MQKKREGWIRKGIYYFCILFIATGLFISGKSSAAERQNRVELLPQLEKVNSWIVKPEKGELQVGKIDNNLKIKFNTTPGNKGEILLKKPLPILQWANGIVPIITGHQSYPFLRDISKWAGVPIYTDSNNPWFWAYLLKQKQGATYYAMVSRLISSDTPSNPDTAIIKFPLFANGKYKITEFISGKYIGQMSGEQLRTYGINVKLAPQQVAIYQIKK